ncbi:MAG: hypothetical protein IJR47_04665, partial [Clostridia bacterium]|nr:hypothetical protein [Clostridia bacterium]
IENPQLAFKEWQRVLKKGGRTVYFDANWYLYLYDEELKKQREYGQKLCIEKFGDDHSLKNITLNLESIAMDLELSKEVRPAWDERALKNAGMNVLNIDEDIYLKVWDEKEKTLHAANPMFMVVAEKA